MSVPEAQAGPPKRRRILADLGEDEEDSIALPQQTAGGVHSSVTSDLPSSPLINTRRDERGDGSDLEEHIPQDGEEDRPGEQEDDELADDVSEAEGEDIMENMEADYVAIPELDTYDTEGIDRREYGAMTYDARRAAEAEIARRTEHRGRLHDILDRFGDEDEEARDRRRGLWDQRRQRREEMRDIDDPPEEEEIDLDAFNVSLTEWLNEPRTRREVKRRFRKALELTKESNTRSRYLDAIRSMCAANLTSLEMHYETLKNDYPTLALWLMDAPEDILHIFDEVANEVVLQQFPHYKNMVKEDVHVRIVGHEIIVGLRELRVVHLDKLVRVVGVVTRRTQVFPQVHTVTFECINCKTTIGPYKAKEVHEMTREECHVCNRPGSYRVSQAGTVYRNYQKLTLQESPGSVPAGRVPRYKEVVLTADLIDRARPGEEVEVTGIYKYKVEDLNQRNGFPVVSTAIDANHVHKREDMFSMLHISDEDKSAIHRIASAPNTTELLLKSFAPSIHGHHHVKLALLLALFSGVEKNISNKHRIRGDINVLLLGDPGTAKSQFLKYLEQVAPRAVYTTGKGASAVGLTAGVHKDPVTKEWTLEGGALVLADRGMCLIDEFDKMNDADRTSIHEALEQQSISVSKAGIVTSLQARCSVVAAANPIGGRYDSSVPFADNVELTDPILQRLDVLCVLQDIVDPLVDERLAEHVTQSHKRNHPNACKEPDDPEQIQGVSQELLTKYIMYARSNIRPQIHNIDQHKIERLYVDMRRESKQCGGVPIAVRHIESIVRLSEAHAKMRLRDYVRDDDVNVAIGVMLHSFLAAQKLSARSSLERTFRRYIVRTSDYNQLLMTELQKLMKDNLTYNLMRRSRNQHEDSELHVALAELEERAAELRVYDVRPFLQSELFRSNRLVVETVSDRNRVAARVIRQVL